MRRILPLLMLITLAMPVSSLSIVEFYPDTYLPEDADEYLILEGEGSLDGVTISDGEGGFRFPSETWISGTLTVARQGIAFHQVHGIDPDFELYDTSPAIPEVVRGGNFQLSNTRDQIYLYQDGQKIQEISWPDTLASRTGQVHFYEGGGWDPRPLAIGQSRFGSLTVENVTLITFVSPDSAFQVFSRAVTDAEHTLQVNVYEFSSTRMTSLLLEARNRGVKQTFLLEGGPVGGILAEEHCALRQLAAEGVILRIMETQGTSHAKYRFNHAKYMIIDDQGILLASENFNDNGFPAPTLKGNRGWGVYIRDPRVAAYFQKVFDWDITGEDIVPYQPSSAACIPASDAAYHSEFPAQEFTGATVTPVLAPDTSILISEMIQSTERSLEIEQAYIKNYSRGEPNPYLEAAFDAARRGVVVRVLLDSSWFNVNEANDNDEMAAFINERGIREGIPISARCADLDQNNLDKIHNKGVIVDGEQVLISSINWNEQSPSFNREAGVIIRHPGVGGYYLEVFNDDWNASANAPYRGIDETQIAAAILVICLLTGYYFLRIKR